MSSGVGSVGERYHREGYAVVRTVAPPALLGQADRHLSTLVVGETGIAATSIETDAVAASIASEAVLVELASAVLGSPVVAFGVTYLVKEPSRSLPVRWHQDGHPWAERLGIDEAVTVWIALDESSVASGCMWVVPGSHRLGAQPLRECHDPPNVFGWASPVDLVDEGAAIPVELARGDVSLHHPALLHRSGPNRSASRRAALAIRFRSASTAQPIES